MTPPRPSSLGRRLVCVALAAVAGALPAHAQGTTSAPRPTAPMAALDTTAVRRLPAWLAGCWESRTTTRVTTEMWMRPDGGLMIGGSRTVVRDVAREFEHLRLEATAAALTYVAQPGGRSPTRFRASHVSDTLLVFEDPTHDFPQRIRYRRIRADSLEARVEGGEGATARGFDFPMRRVGCDASP